MSGSNVPKEVISAADQIAKRAGVSVEKVLEAFRASVRSGRFSAMDLFIK